DAVGAVLAGGDVTRSPGPVVVDVVVVGEADAPVLRRGARPGDGIWVTGELGGAAAAVRVWSRGEAVPAGLRERFARPVPRLGAMAWLRATGLVTSGMDLSDGLLQDAGHLAAASGLCMSLRAEQVPVSPAVRETLGEEEGLWAALSGGEDYELVVTARPGLESHAEAFAREVGVPLTRVGTVEAGEGARVLGPDGAPLSPPAVGFDHFPARGPGAR
ncbi:MAG TPA: AIR synthase-related protein, partial [Longimicrobiales bacterium]|nr:AIR synthase-related protein [Longimicrobiales bacterium]